jgi:hypothetical protein
MAMYAPLLKLSGSPPVSLYINNDARHRNFDDLITQKSFKSCTERERERVRVRKKKLHMKKSNKATAAFIQKTHYLEVSVDPIKDFRVLEIRVGQLLDQSCDHDPSGVDHRVEGPL